jgi:hypothetical protein
VGVPEILLKCRRYADEEPVDFNHVHLPHARFQDQLALNLAGNLL